MNNAQPPSDNQPSAAQPNGAAFPDLNALAVELADVSVSFAQSLHRGEPPHKRMRLAERLHELRELFGDPRAELGVLTDGHALWRWERVEVPDADPATFKQWRCAKGEWDGVFVECLVQPPIVSAGGGWPVVWQHNFTTDGPKKTTWRAGNYTYGTMIYTSPPVGDLYADKALARHAEHAQRKVSGGAL